MKRVNHNLDEAPTQNNYEEMAVEGSGLSIPSKNPKEQLLEQYELISKQVESHYQKLDQINAPSANQSNLPSSKLSLKSELQGEKKDNLDLRKTIVLDSEDQEEEKEDKKETLREQEVFEAENYRSINIKNQEILSKEQEIAQRAQQL